MFLLLIILPFVDMPAFVCNLTLGISDNTFERIFDLSVDNEELVWHRDRKTRFVKVLEGVGWKFQFDNELPKEIGPGSTIHINKKCYHRLIKGSTPLKVRIVEL